MANTASPLPSENPHWPAWYFPPEVDHGVEPHKVGLLFKSAEDVPDGWVFYPSYVKVREPKPAEDEQPQRMSRQDICRALDELGEVYKPNAGYAALKRQYDDALAVLQSEDEPE
jgi:hypothetical protein